MAVARFWSRTLRDSQRHLFDFHDQLCDTINMEDDIVLIWHDQAEVQAFEMKSKSLFDGLLREIDPD